VGSEEAARGTGARRRGVALSAAFFLGLVLSLVVLGTLAAVMGRLLTRWKVAFALGTAAVSLVAGLAALLGPALRRRVPDPNVRRRRGTAGAFVYGLLYSVATITTSAGPLMLLLTVATAIGRPAYGAALSLTYAVGRGLPFLLLGFFAGAVGGWVAGVERYRRPAEIASGIALVGLAGYFVRFALVLA
jgi:cytochrome c-type biogenesis protein